MDSITLPSPAKVNLFLRILGKRPDGFHELETVMAALDLADEMRFERRPCGITIECSAPGVPCDDSNLAVRAARLLQERFGIQAGTHIVLRKRTPVGGGMGGGSSNAATTLRALGRLWELSASQSEFETLASRLGSDVPFFLRPSVAMCRGRGEIIEPISAEKCRALQEAAVVLVNPGFGVPTPWAYRSYAARGGVSAEPKRDAGPLLRALASADLIALAGELYNSLEPAVFRKYPILEMFRRSLVEAGASGALMSGSGATVFGLCLNVRAAEDVRSKIMAKFGPSLWTHVARFAAFSGS